MDVARHDGTGEPAAARAEAAGYGMQITSYHLPRIEQDIETGLANALAAARYAARLGDGVVVLFKAQLRDIFAQTAGRFLDAVERERLGVVPVLQNHAGTAISTLEDFRDVLGTVNDPASRSSWKSDIFSGSA